MVTLIMESKKVIIMVKIMTTFGGNGSIVIRMLHEGPFSSINVPFFYLFFAILVSHCVIKKN